MGDHPAGSEFHTTSIALSVPSGDGPIDRLAVLARGYDLEIVHR